MDKIELIERSMRAFYFGLPGLLPVLGTPFAIIALVINARLKRRAGAQWNPAQRYLFWGMVCARIGTSSTVICILFVIATLLIDLLG